jgi:Glycosyl hydrolase family 1
VSTWDTYAHTPGKIKNDENGDLANDHYQRYKEDVALMRSIGATAYRFSIAWPRIYPAGIGEPNPKNRKAYRSTGISSGAPRTTSSGWTASGSRERAHSVHQFTRMNLLG